MSKISQKLNPFQKEIIASGCGFDTFYEKRVKKFGLKDPFPYKSFHALFEVHGP